MRAWGPIPLFTASDWTILFTCALMHCYSKTLQDWPQSLKLILFLYVLHIFHTISSTTFQVWTVTCRPMERRWRLNVVPPSPLTCLLGCSRELQVSHYSVFPKIGKTLPLFLNKPVAQSPQCTSLITQNVPFYCRNVHISVTKRCFLGYLSNALLNLWDEWCSTNIEFLRDHAKILEFFQKFSSKCC